jgi:hypothetical protein
MCQSHLPTYLSALPAHLLTSTPVNMPTPFHLCCPCYLSTLLPAHLFSCFSLYLPTSLHDHLSVPISLCTYLYIYLFTSLPAHLFNLPTSLPAHSLPSHLSSCPPLYLYITLLYLPTPFPLHLSACTNHSIMPC